MTWTTGSLCTGYAGLEQGLGMVLDTELAWVSEVDPSACAVLEARFPGVPNLGDLTVLDWSSVPRVDILTGGYPCQPFSTAGRRKGADDERHLWPFIKDAVRVLRPRLVVLENVAGHLSLGFDVVLADLAEIGFDAEWCVVRASDVGACHQRARLFVVAHPQGDEGRLIDGDALRAGSGADGRGSATGPRAPADAERSGRDGRPRAKGRGTGRGAAPGGAGEGRDPACAECGCAEWLHDEQGFCAGCGECTDGGRRLPNSALADPGGMGRGAGPGLRPDGMGGQRGRRSGDDDGPATSHTHGQGPQGPQPAPGRDLPDWGAYGPAIARHAAVLGRPAPHPVDGKGRLNPVFVEWMQLLEEGWVTGVPGITRAKYLKLLGNGVLPLQAAYALFHLLRRIGW